MSCMSTIPELFYGSLLALIICCGLIGFLLQKWTRPPIYDMKLVSEQISRVTYRARLRLIVIGPTAPTFKALYCSRSCSEKRAHLPTFPTVIRRIFQRYHAHAASDPSAGTGRPFHPSRKQWLSHVAREFGLLCLAVLHEARLSGNTVFLETR